MAAAQDREASDYAELTDIDGIGPAVAEDILAFFAEPHKQDVLSDLDKELRVGDFKARTRANSPLSGKTIVFPDTLQAMTRSEPTGSAQAPGPTVGEQAPEKTTERVVCAHCLATRTTPENGAQNTT